MFLLLTVAALVADPAPRVRYILEDGVMRTEPVAPPDVIRNPISAGEDANKLPLTPPPKLMPAVEEYTSFLARVRQAAGAKLRLKVTAGHFLVGKFSEQYNRAIEVGDEFDCFVEGGGEKMEKPKQQAARSEVRAPLTFQSASNSVGSELHWRDVTNTPTPVVTGKDHHCPACRSGPWLMIESYNQNGTHNHRCGYCGTLFAH